MDGCVGVSVCMGMHVHLSILYWLKRQLPPLSPPLVLVFHATAPHCIYILLHTSSPAHSSSPPPPSSLSLFLLHPPCSEVQHGSFSTWTVCTGILWATLVRPLSVTDVPSTCPRIHRDVGFVGLSNTLRRLGKLDDAVKTTRAALDINFDEVGVCMHGMCQCAFVVVLHIRTYVRVHLHCNCNFIIRLQIHSV